MKDFPLWLEIAVGLLGSLESKSLFIICKNLWLKLIVYAHLYYRSEQNVKFIKFFYLTLSIFIWILCWVDTHTQIVFIKTFFWCFVTLTTLFCQWLSILTPDKLVMGAEGRLCYFRTSVTHIMNHILACSNERSIVFSQLYPIMFYKW